MADLGAEVIVVDNDSQDDSAHMVREKFPYAKFISNTANFGYSRAVNQGIKESEGRYILILNADTIIKPNAIQSLLSFMDGHPETAIAGPRLFYPDGRLQYSCRTFYAFKTILFRRTFLGKLFPESRILKEHLMTEWDHGTEREVDWLLGAALIVRRESIEQVGLMDERYFLYLEDVDWCYRMKTAGFKVCYVPHAEIIHYHRQGSRSEAMFSRDVVIHLASMLRYYDKWSKVLLVLKKAAQMIKSPVFMVLDFAAILFSFFLAFYLRKAMGNWMTNPLYPASIYYVPVLLFSLLTIFSNYLLGLYKTSRSMIWADRFFIITKSTLIAGVIMFLLLLLSRGYQVGFLYSRIVMACFLIITMLLITLTHQGVHMVSRWLWLHRFNLKRILIVGQDQTAVDIENEISKDLGWGYDPAGFISISDRQNDLPVYPALGGIDELIEICERERIQEVVFVNIDRYYEKVIYPLIRCGKNMIDCRIVSDDFSSAAVDSRIIDFVGFPSLDFELKPSYYIGLGIKRIMDVVISLSGLIILSPILFLIILWAKIKEGEIFFVQKRVGKEGREFFMYKFRTMVKDAQDQKERVENMATGPLFKAKSDPRVTGFGRFLRKYNLDEIPQLINVLKGEMSIIGPRPPLPEEVEYYEDWHRARLEVKPGITGLWQVDKERKWKFDEMVKLDIFYIMNCSPLLDLKILLRTPGAIMRGTGFPE
jgi:exopolysaccharide biosynthesis polyprenyl glycosylphosphotransferase